MNTPRMRQWERAEIERSAVEASLTPDAHLRVSARTLQRYERPSPETAYPLEYAYFLVGDVGGRRVLDLGCGSGANTVQLAHRGAQVCGLDISEDLIRIAGRRVAVHGLQANASFVAASAHDLPFAGESFDLVFGSAVLHHLDLQLVSREVHRVLRPGGRAIFKEPVRNSPLLRGIRSLIPYRAPDISPFERPLTEDEVRRFAAPFSLVHVRAFGLPHVLLGEVLSSRPTHVDALYRSDRALLRAMPALGYYAGIRVLQVTK